MLSSGCLLAKGKAQMVTRYDKLVKSFEIMVTQACVPYAVCVTTFVQNLASFFIKESTFQADILNICNYVPMRIHK